MHQTSPAATGGIKSTLFTPLSHIRVLFHWTMTVRFWHQSVHEPPHASVTALRSLLPLAPGILCFLSYATTARCLVGVPSLELLQHFLLNYNFSNFAKYFEIYPCLILMPICLFNSALFPGQWALINIYFIPFNKTT